MQRGVAAAAEDARHRQRRLHPHDAGAPRGARRRRSCSGSTTRATSTRASTRRCTASAARSSSRRAEIVDGTGEYEGQKVCAIHSKPRRAAAGEELLLPDEPVRRPRCSPSTRSGPTSCSPESARNEVVSFVQQGLADLSISRSSFDWGIKVPWDESPRRLRVVRRAAELHHRGRLRRRTRRQFERRWPADAHRRQGHPALPRRHLAGDADGRGPRGARPGLRARLAARRRREDVEVEAHRHRARRRSPTPSARTRSATTSCARSTSARTARSAGRTSRPATRRSSPTASATSHPG